MTETREQREIHVAGDAWFSPALNCHAAYQAAAPTLSAAELLDCEGSLEDSDHFRSFANRRCISTKPEVVRIGKVTT